MAALYFTNDGTQVTYADIKTAVDAGRARLVHRYRTATALSLQGEDWDTRNDDIDMSGKSWTTQPASTQQAAMTARVILDNPYELGDA